MSLYGALLTGVSGLDANSRALSITSSNIANVNTVGYKASSAAFSTFLAGSGAEVASSSVLVKAQQHLNQQGLLTTTGSATDLAVSGNGFFLVCENPDNPASFLYTRAGAFAPDADGFLRNSAGYYLEGWTLNPDGTLPANRSTVSAIDLSTLNGTAQETENISLRLNLESSVTAVGAYAPGDMFNDVVTPQFEQTINVYDSQGGSQPIRLAFVKTAANTWAYEAIYDGNVANIGGAGNNPDRDRHDHLQHRRHGRDAADRLLPSRFPGPPPLVSRHRPSTSISARRASDGLTQFDSASTLYSRNRNGALFGALHRRRSTATAS